MAEPNEGFIYLHRRIREHPYWQDPERLRAWLDCLFMAAWKRHRRLVGTKQVELDRGQFIASDRFLMKRWRWSRGKVRRFMEAAQEANEIRPTGSTSNGTIYTVVKYDTYQDHRPTNDTSNGTTTGPPSVPPPDQIEVREKKGKKNTTTHKKRAERLPADFTPNDTHHRIADEEGVDIDRELAKFTDHAEATERTLKDWDAGFRMWLRKASEFRNGKGKGKHGADRSETPQSYDYDDAPGFTGFKR